MAAPSGLLRALAVPSEPLPRDSVKGGSGPRLVPSLLGDRDIKRALDLIPGAQPLDRVLQAIARVIERNIPGSACTIEFRAQETRTVARRRYGCSSTRQLIAFAESVSNARPLESTTRAAKIRPRGGSLGGELLLTLSTSRSISIDEEGLIAAGLRLGALAAEYRQLDSEIARHDKAVQQKAGSNSQFTKPDGMGTREIARDLRYALERDEFKLVYQPQVCLNDRLIGMEALIRWKHPRIGMLSPETFIGIAEETGLIMPIGEWVISEACRQNAEWNDRLETPVKVAVNVSALQLYFSDLTGIIERSLNESGLPANCLEIELTETTVMRNTSEAAKTLQTLRDLGLSVAIDDFGIGYSSLSYLATLPVDLLKIDRIFLQQIHTDTTATVVRGIAALGHSLGLSVVAEGVETREQWDTIRTMGVDIAQGFLIGHPMQADKALEWMTPYVRDGRSLARSNE